MSNVPAEQLLMAALVKYPDKFFELESYLTEEDFAHTDMQTLFLVLRSLYVDREAKKISKAKFAAEAHTLKIGNFQSIAGNSIDAILNHQVALTEVPHLFEAVKRETIIRSYKSELLESSNYLKQTDDSGTVIITELEKRFVGKFDIMDHGDLAVTILTDGIWKAIDEMADNPGQIGLDIGFPELQVRVGQIRCGSVTFVAGNTKSGKSQMGLSAARYVAGGKHKLPVFLVDSEMTAIDQQVRLVGMSAKVPYGIIESGYWALSELELKKEGIPEAEIIRIIEYGKRIRDPELRRRVQELPIYYCTTAGQTVEEVIPRIRQWLATKVKPSPDAKFPECLIVWDYIKLAHVDELKGGRVGEYQVHGLNFAALHNFAKKYNVPVLTFGQTNRELDDSPNCIAGAKRIRENVDSVSLLRKKTADEKSADPNGDYMIRSFEVRHGPGTPYGYINVSFKPEIGEFKELGYGSVDFAQVKQDKLNEWKKKKADDHGHKDDD